MIDQPGFLDHLNAAVAFIQRHEDAVTAAVGTALLVIILVAMRVSDKRTGRPDRLLRKWVGLAILGFSAEGMWEVATQDLTLPPGLAIAFFAVGDAAIIVEIIAAERSRMGSVEQRRHIRAVWGIAATMGAIVMFSADSPVEVPLRFALPLLAVALWKLGLKAIGQSAEVERDENALVWMVVPWLRQKVIAAGLARPGKKDRGTVDRDRLIAQVKNVRFDLHRATGAGEDKTVAKLRAKLHRLALDADDDILAAAAAQVQRAIVAEARTRPLIAEEIDRIEAAEQSAREAAADAVRIAVELQSEQARAERAEQAAAVLAEQTAERVAEQVAERADGLRAEFAVQLAALQAEHARKLSAAKSRAAKAPRSGGRQNGAGDEAEQRPGVPRMSDEQAVAAMLRAHPERDYEWKSREVHRLTGAGFTRAPKLIVLVAEHHTQGEAAEQMQSGSGDIKEDAS